jgi:hypothetical protein
MSTVVVMLGIINNTRQVIQLTSGYLYSPKIKSQTGIHMGNFAILRTQKLTSKAKIAMAGRHNSRSEKVENADPEGKIYLLAGSNEPLDAYEKIVAELGIKERKNAVPAFEIIQTFSPTMASSIDIGQWTKDNIAFIENKYGRDRILSMHLHMDETTPHIHTVIIPTVNKQKNGKEASWGLSCRDFLGGKDKLIALQDEYAKAMEPHNLERGNTNSKAKHQEIRAYYKEFNTTISQINNQLDDVSKEKDQKTAFMRLIEITKTALMHAKKTIALEATIEKMKKKLAIFSIAGRGLTESEVISTLVSAAIEKQKRLDRESIVSTIAREPETPSVPVLAQIGAEHTDDAKKRFMEQFKRPTVDIKPV